MMKKMDACIATALAIGSVTFDGSSNRADAIGFFPKEQIGAIEHVDQQSEQKTPDTIQAKTSRLCTMLIDPEQGMKGDVRKKIKELLEEAEKQEVQVILPKNCEAELNPPWLEEPAFMR